MPPSKLLPKPLSRSILSLSKTTPGIPAQVKVTQWGSPMADAQHVVFYFGGMPSSAEEPTLHSAASDNDDVYACRKIHLICIDKPGHGDSSLAYQFQIRRDWPVVVDQVARLLKVPAQSRYGVMGVSNGGPYVMATLTHPTLKHRIKAAAMIVGVSDVLASGYFSWRTPSTFFEGIYNSLPTIVAAPFTAMGLVMGKLYLFGLGGYESIFPEMPTEAKSGLRRVLDDSLKNVALGAQIDCQQGLSPLYARRRDGTNKKNSSSSVDQDAQEAYENIDVPVTLWYGNKDSSVPMATAQWLQQTIGSNAKLHTLDVGHGLYFFHPDTVLDELVRIMEESESQKNEAQNPTTSTTTTTTNY